MSQEIIELLKKALKKGKDNLPNTWEIDRALALLKAEQPSEGEFCDFMEEVKDEIKKAPKMFHQLQKRDELIKELRTNLDKKDKLLFAYESVRAPTQPLTSEYPDSEFTKVQRKAAQLAADAYEEDEEWCPTKTIRLLEACDRLDASKASCKELKELLTEYGRHSPGCSQEFGSKYHCRCGWSEVEANKQGD